MATLLEIKYNEALNMKKSKTSKEKEVKKEFLKEDKKQDAKLMNKMMKNKK